MADQLYQSINFIQILNTDEQLSAFPVEGYIDLVFDAPIDTLNANDYIYIIREKPNQDVVNIAFNEVKYIGEINVDYYDIVVSTLELNASTSSTFTYRLTPNQPLLPNNNYHLVISKTIAPLFYTIEKTNSLGPSVASLLVDLDYSSTITASTDYVIVITQTSQLSSGSHIIKYTLDGGSEETLEVKTQTIEIVSGVNVAFNPNIPILANESFTVTLVPMTRLGETKSQSLVTYINDGVLTVSAEDKSSRLSTDTILKFYEDNGFARRVNGSTDEASSTDTTTVSDIDYKFAYPNVLFINTGIEIDDTSLTDEAFYISIDRAFDNYMLDSLGLYSDSNKYVVTYSLVTDDFGEYNTIKFVITYDTASLVPDGETFILQKA